MGSDKLAPRLQQMIDGWEREDPPTLKKLPVEADVPELIVTEAERLQSPPLLAAVGDLAMIAYYYLLRVGEYTVKGQREESKRTQQFKLGDIAFFRRDKRGKLRLLSRNARDDDILTADSATLKLDNQKNGWKNVCINHAANGDPTHCPVRALGRRYIYIRSHLQGTRGWGTFLSAYWVDGARADVTAKDMSKALKWAASRLDYPEGKGIPVDRVDTHSLRMGGANALALSGHSDMEIQKMGRWRGDTFKEYVREELAGFSEGMSTAMKQNFGFVNIAASTLRDVTSELVDSAYTVNASTAAAAA